MLKVVKSIIPEYETLNPQEKFNQELPKYAKQVGRLWKLRTFIREDAKKNLLLMAGPLMPNPPPPPCLMFVGTLGK